MSARAMNFASRSLSLRCVLRFIETVLLLAGRRAGKVFRTAARAGCPFEDFG
jgi:hypothetical protein